MQINQNQSIQTSTNELDNPQQIYNTANRAALTLPSVSPQINLSYSKQSISGEK